MAIRFEWDQTKNRANQRKHGISFEQAQRVFADPRHRIEEDRVVGDEERFHAIGLLSDMRVAVVVHVSTFFEGGDEVIRIISAWKAEGWEERLYEEQNG